MSQAATGGAGARLRQEFDRLKNADPFLTLGIAPSADTAAIRWAFLELTKRYHPNRFAREASDVQQLATEVFLLIRRAYEVLNDEQKRRVWRDRVGSGMTAPATPVNPIVIPSKPIETVRPLATPQSAPVAPGRAVTQAPEVKPTPTVAAYGATRTAPPASRTVPPATRTVPPATRTVPPPTRTVPPATRTAPPATRTAPPATRTTPPVSFKAPAAPAMPAKPSGPDVNAVLEQARTRALRFEEAQRLLSHGSYREAREAFHKIAAEDPQSKRYRVYLHYAWGLEHRAAGKIEEAVKELERAVALEPEFADAKKDLEKTKDSKKSGGIFSKLFGR
jgi:hypothetical protein